MRDRPTMLRMLIPEGSTKMPDPMRLRPLLKSPNFRYDDSRPTRRALGMSAIAPPDEAT